MSAAAEASTLEAYVRTGAASGLLRSIRITSVVATPALLSQMRMAIASSPRPQSMIRCKADVSGIALR
jgi:hypothetical protein